MPGLEAAFSILQTYGGRGSRLKLLPIVLQVLRFCSGRVLVMETEESLPSVEVVLADKVRIDHFVSLQPDPAIGAQHRQNTVAIAVAADKPAEIA
jgi:hypothetical protein